MPDPTPGDLHPGPYPNVFLIGALGAGTEWVAAAMAEHPQVFCPSPAAPHHHCIDLPGLVEATGFVDDDEYLDLYEPVGPQHSVILDASPTSLASLWAVERIEAATARSARYVVVVREPAELVAAHFAEQVEAGNEDRHDLAEAWDLQERRAAGEAIPDGCEEPGLLQYRRLAEMGRLTERLLSQVPRSRVRFVEYEALAASPAELEGLFAWLGLRPPAEPFTAPRVATIDLRLTITEATLATIRAELRDDLDYLDLLSGLDLSGV